MSRSPSPLSHLDRAFGASASVCLALRVPLDQEGPCRDSLKHLSVYVEQSCADDHTITLFVPPNLASWLLHGVIQRGRMYGAVVTLPDTPRGQEIAHALPRHLLPLNPHPPLEEP